MAFDGPVLGYFWRFRVANGQAQASFGVGVRAVCILVVGGLPRLLLLLRRRPRTIVECFRRLFLLLWRGMTPRPFGVRAAARYHRLCCRCCPLRAFRACLCTLCACLRTLRGRRRRRRRGRWRRGRGILGKQAVEDPLDLLAPVDTFGIDGAQLRGGRVRVGFLDSIHLQPDQRTACQLLGHLKDLACGGVGDLPELIRPADRGLRVSVGVRQAVHWHEAGAVFVHVSGQAAHGLLRIAVGGQQPFIRRDHGQLEGQRANCVRLVLQHQGVVVLAPEALPAVGIPPTFGIPPRSGARLWCPPAAQEGLLQRAFGRALNLRVDHDCVDRSKLGEALQHVRSVDLEVFGQALLRQPLDQRRVPLRSVLQGICAPLFPAHGAVAALRHPVGALQCVHFVRTQMAVHGGDPLEVVPVHDDRRYVEAVERLEELVHPHVRPVEVLGRENDAPALRPCIVERLVKVVPPLLHLGVVALERTRHVGAGLHLPLWTPQVRGGSIEPLVAVGY
eukprot:scaffold16490_cov73-Phaeocystis_antarctica.AAC.9